jgi:hypothetical protein
MGMSSSTKNQLIMPAMAVHEKTKNEGAVAMAGTMKAVESKHST